MHPGSGVVAAHESFSLLLSPFKGLGHAAAGHLLVPSSFEGSRKSGTSSCSGPVQGLVKVTAPGCGCMRQTKSPPHLPLPRSLVHTGHSDSDRYYLQVM